MRLTCTLLVGYISDYNKLSKERVSCVIKKSYMFIYCVGVHDRRVSDQVQRIGVSEIHINNRAITKGYGNDIALIKLSRPALLGNSVGLACLPSGDPRDRVAPGTKCFLTGN